MSLGVPVKAQQAETQPDYSQSQPLPRSVIDVGFEALQKFLSNNLHDTESWKKLVTCAEESGETEKIHIAYNLLLRQYPHTTSAQIAYINHFLHDRSMFKEAEGLFKRFIKVSPSVELLRFYLTYVRRVNSGPSSRDVIRKSYEFALALIGQDQDSGDIWYDYLSLLRSSQTSSVWEEQQKIDAIRKAIHRAVQIPLNNVERLWGELETFENGFGHVPAKKILQILSPGYMRAKSALRELIEHTLPLYPPATQTTPNPPPSDFFLPALPSFTASERQNVGRWKRYLRWEENDPLMLEEKDKVTLIARIWSAYRKATFRMRYFPEIWFMAYKWLTSIGKNDEAEAQLKLGVEFNPSSFALNFALAEALEAKKEYTEVDAVYNKFISILRDEMNALDTAEKTRLAEQAEVSAPTESNAIALGRPVDQLNGGLSNPSSSTSKEIEERRREYGTVYINYMRFVRRVEGVNATRPLFIKARKDPLIPWQVYESTALMEYHCSGEKEVATKIFERGMTLFGNNKDYVLHYLSFLIAINDSNNARALFERVISTFQPTAARDLWDQWAHYENHYGDLETVRKLENRFVEVYPSESSIKRFASRYTYLQTDGIASRDLGFARAKKEFSTTNTLVAVNTGNSPLVHRRSASNTGRSSGQSLKRQPEDDLPRSGNRRHGEDRDHEHKRQRVSSHGGRYDGPPRRQSPARSRKSDTIESRERDKERDREEHKPVNNVHKTNPAEVRAIQLGVDAIADELVVRVMYLWWLYFEYLTYRCSV
ncbi:mRNA 3'-end-processing protein rna14 [Marasmius tenuissimus]|uniref:mRNA 3'-end-processing protein RNA14 n=1 Tax=Marasmius tenuissimus TaxID=585030 RepID=A0ABR2ZKX0_9AGAR